MSTPDKLDQSPRKEETADFNAERRQFTKIGLAGALGGAAWLSQGIRASGAGPDPGAARPRPAPGQEAKTKLRDFTPGIKIAVQLRADPTDEDLQFVKQLGVEHVTIWVHADGATAENFVRLRAKVEAAGLQVWNIGDLNVHNMEEVTLNLPGRDQKIEEYKNYLRNLGKAGIAYTTYAHMAMASGARSVKILEAEHRRAVSI